nr:hypothetical protein [Tanacetum cinerariifolium]
MLRSQRVLARLVRDPRLAAGVEGPGVDDESYGLDDESYGLDDRNYGLDDESYDVDDESHSLDAEGRASPMATSIATIPDDEDQFIERELQEMRGRVTALERERDRRDR